jgi:hypothetical protein
MDSEYSGAANEQKPIALVQRETEPAMLEQAALAGSSDPTPAIGSTSLTSPEDAPAWQEAADPFQDFRRKLTEKEWNSAGTRILILEKISRLESEVTEYKSYRSRFYEKDKEAAILHQKLTRSNTIEALFDFCLAAGGVLIGLATLLFDKGHWALGVITLLMGVVLLVWPLALKHFQKSE